MVALTLLKPVWEALEQSVLQEHAADLQTSSPGLAKSIREGTVTLGEIDSFLRKGLQLPPDLKSYLLSKKAHLLSEEGRFEEALEQYDVALGIQEAPSTWLIKGTTLLQAGRVDEAIQAFRRAYSLKDKLGKQRQGYLADMCKVWSTVALYRGLFDGVLGNNATELGKNVNEYLEVREIARDEDLEDAVASLPFPEQFMEDFTEALWTSVAKEYAAKGQPVPANAVEKAQKELQDALEELELAVRLLSIKDPFEGWRAFTKEISKVWPEGVSAVDAIREQRE